MSKPLLQASTLPRPPFHVWPQACFTYWSGHLSTSECEWSLLLCLFAVIGKPVPPWPLFRNKPAVVACKCLMHYSCFVMMSAALSVPTCIQVLAICGIRSPASGHVPASVSGLLVNTNRLLPGVFVSNLEAAPIFFLASWTSVLGIATSAWAVSPMAAKSICTLT